MIFPQSRRSRADHFLKEYVFGPLEMKDTAFYLEPEQEKRLVRLYKKEDTGLLDVTDTGEDMDGVIHRAPGKQYFCGSGGIFSTVVDYEHLADMLCAGGMYNGKMYLKQETVELMGSEGPKARLEPEPGYVWGLGVKIRQNREKGNFEATEGTYGWSGAFGTHLFVSPKDHLECVFVSNLSNAGGSGFPVSRKIEDTVFQVFVKRP